MWKLDFYILPSKCYSNITEEDIENLDDKVTYINMYQMKFTISGI